MGEDNIGGKVFYPGVGPATPDNSFEISEKAESFVSFERTLENMPKKEVPSVEKNHPNYLAEENAKALFDREVENGDILSPLSVTYYLSTVDKYKAEEKAPDLKGALEEQGKVWQSFTSKQKLSSNEWEVALQNPSGWKEIRHAMNDNMFWEKTRKYLTVAGITAGLNKNDRLGRVLQKTAEMIKPNLTNSSNGA